MLKLHRVAGDSSSPQGGVVFVHGLGGDPHATWSHDGTDAGFWPDWLAREAASADVYTLSYPAAWSRWFGSAMPLPERATNLLAELVAQRLHEKSLVFICHSLGGLVVKEALRLARESGDARLARLVERTRGVVFIATPHDGSAGATWLVRVRRLVRASDVIIDLQAHSPRAVSARSASDGVSGELAFGLTIHAGGGGWRGWDACCRRTCGIGL
jgi:hypothetical protein